MKSNLTTVLAIVLSCAVADVLAQAQTTRSVPASNLQLLHPLQSDTQTPTERITALETQMAQLTAQVKSLNTQLTQTSKTAFDANFKAGLATIWINANGDAAIAAGQWVSGGAPNQLNQILTVVTQNAQGIKDVDARLNVVCKNMIDHVKGQIPMDSFAACRAGFYDSSAQQKWATPFY